MRWYFAYLYFSLFAEEAWGHLGTNVGPERDMSCGSVTWICEAVTEKTEASFSSEPTLENSEFTSRLVSYAINKKFGYILNYQVIWLWNLSITSSIIIIIIIIIIMDLKGKCPNSWRIFSYFQVDCIYSWHLFIKGFSICSC